ncbi:four-carbon acid sugar kinase family protein [uncultured Duncaniella sp.]|uniref:four-carbon acid sugar kinase family protein n=1 Tax=uncultured Duncaniella sp. TaxID=2768039 RepID=UPI0025A9F4D7|nr:four-carbon acid sugar kinase family protein [uncultured Duncaniella sp.]
MIAVIADDITGAAEMAGIAHRLGLRVKLTMQPESASDCDVLVIATDTRSMTEEEAAAGSARVAGALGAMPDVDSLFKKTDSALRGHVVAELEAILANTGYRKALYLPANPSKGRTIRDGVYYIGGKPLHETDFSFDPEFPAFSSRLIERLPMCEEKKITCADAESENDVAKAVETAADDILLAGAADMFTAFLRRKFPACRETSDCLCAFNLADSLIICGSTQSKPIDCGIATSYMPTEVYDEKTSADGWTARLVKDYNDSHAMIIAVRDRHRTGKHIAVYLRETMARISHALVSCHRPAELVIEGGATAFAIINRLGWNSFTITEEIAPGVIRMQADNGTHVTMKPGSYPWGNLFRQ